MELTFGLLSAIALVFTTAIVVTVWELLERWEERPDDTHFPEGVD
jgi:hypothetical protein